MSRHHVILMNDRLRNTAVDYVRRAPAGTRLEFKGPKRSSNQNAKLWACLSDIARDVKWQGKIMTADSWKLMFLDALKRARAEELHIVPNLDNTGFVNLSTSSSDLPKEEMADLITLVIAFGDRQGVEFSEKEAA